MKEKKGGCCSNEHKFYKLTEEHKNVSNQHINSFPFDAVINPSQIFNNNNIASVQRVILLDASPPGDPGPPLYISNCVFLI